MLRVPGIDEIIVFREERRRYLQLFRQAGLDGVVTPRPLISMVEPSLLKSICQYGLEIDVDAVTDEQLDEWLRTFLLRDPVFVAQIDHVMTSIRMNMLIADPKARVVDLLRQFNRIALRMDWIDLFDVAEGIRLKIRYLCEAIEPPELKAVIENLLGNEPKYARHLHDFVLFLQEKAAQFQELLSMMSMPVYINPIRLSNEMLEQNERHLQCVNCGQIGHDAIRCPTILTNRQLHHQIHRGYDTSLRSSPV